MLYLGYTTFRNFYAIFYPTFPEGIQTLDNLIRPGTPLTLDIFVSNEKSPFSYLSWHSVAPGKESENFSTVAD